MMSKPNLPHLAEDTLEMYSMGRLSETEIDNVEDHLLICPVCQDRLTETDQFVHAIRSAARKLELKTRSRALVEETICINSHPGLGCGRLCGNRVVCIHTETNPDGGR